MIHFICISVFFTIFLFNFLQNNTNLFVVVGLLVEIREQEIEQDGMGSNEVCEVNGIVAVVLKEQLEGMHHDQHKLDHLDNS